MQVRYDPLEGLMIHLQVYEKDLSNQILKLLRKEVDKYEGDLELVEAIIVAIAQNKARRQ